LSEVSLRQKKGLVKLKYLHEDLTKKIIKCFYSVYDELGYGFLETVYAKALLLELVDSELTAEEQKDIKVYFKNNSVGNFKADIVVDNKVIIEVKAVKTLLPIHEVQVVNYLKATGIEVGLLVNFGEKLEFKRKVMSNNEKK